MTEEKAPPSLDPARHALLLDFDGSLVDFALTPDAIVVRPETIALLGRLSQRLNGALAIVSGRQIADIDRRLAPLKLSISGVHGLEFRLGGGETTKAPVSGELAEARRRLAQELGPNDRILLEDKGGALVLHIRANPDQRARAERLARRAATNSRRCRWLVVTPFTKFVSRASPRLTQWNNSCTLPPSADASLSSWGMI